MAIRPHGICILTEEESDNWKNTGIRPNCITHRHVATSTAIRWHSWPKINCFLKVEWAGKGALMVVREETPRMWKTAPSGGMSVRQLVRGPAPILNAGTTKNGIPSAGAHARYQDVKKINREVDSKDRA
jgi:hypothetical protein